jgi:hypothetical protein
MCQCAAGFTGPDGAECTACAAGTFKPDAGSAQCQTCLGESFSAAGAEQCTGCPLYAQVLDRTNGSSCTCNAGYARVGASCEACVPGKYKSSVSNQACVGCEAGSYQDSFAAQTCLACPSDSYAAAPGSVSSDLCTCNEGYTRQATSCSACAPGTYKAAVSDEPCALCPADTYSEATGATSATVCASCPENSSTYGVAGAHAVAVCLCEAGFQLASPGVCAACDPGFYCTGHGSREDCMQHADSAGGSKSLLACVCDAGGDGMRRPPGHLITGAGREEVMRKGGGEEVRSV